MYVDVRFAARGTVLPVDHRYFLLSAISNRLPWVHASRDIGIFPVNGTRAGDEIILPQAGATVRLRLPAQRIADVFRLAGTVLRIGGSSLAIGVPTIFPLLPATALRAAMVTIKISQPDSTGKITADAFQAAAHKQLRALEILAEPIIPLHQKGPFAGQPRRKVLQVKGKRIVGFALEVHGLAPEDSLRLQEHGIGGRRLMGCGLFQPMEERGQPNGGT